jgi:hypothetical protein
MSLHKFLGLAPPPSKKEKTVEKNETVCLLIFETNFAVHFVGFVF